MKRIIIFSSFIFILLFASCSDEIRCLRASRKVKEYCKTCNEIKDSVRLHDSTVYRFRDTTIFIMLPKDTVLLHDSIRIVDGMVMNYPRRVFQNGIISGYFQIYNGEFTVKTWINTDGFSITLRGAITEKMVYKGLYEYYYQKQTIEVPKPPGYWKEAIILLETLAIALLLYLKLKK